MSWYKEERDGETKRLLEWALKIELEPEEEPGFYKPKMYRERDKVPSTTVGENIPPEGKGYTTGGNT